LDRIIEILKTNCIRCDVSGSDSPMNVSNFEYVYHFEDGGFEIYSGNYFCGPPRAQCVCCLEDENDTWILFIDQYLDVMD
jgi:hypothetical protein